jgi:large subunit ribosomal protein L6
MSKIGRRTITIPQGVTVEVNANEVVVKGPKGSLNTQLLAGITVTVEGDSVNVSRKNEEKQTKAFHGLIRSLLNNNIAGVNSGFKKTLKLIGTGYRVTAKGRGLSLAVGYSHPVEYSAPDSIKLTVEGSDTIHIEGFDKQVVGQVAANIRAIRPPEPYKGKGIRYEDEVVRRKQGKAAA